jgi:hypothetical protein
MAKTEKHFDRIKAIRKASRNLAEPHGRAGSHADKSARRQRRMSTQDWIAEAEADEPRLFRVECLYDDESGALRTLGALTVEASGEDAAIAEAMARRWDPRLEACLPHFTAEEVEE